MKLDAVSDSQLSEVSQFLAAAFHETSSAPFLTATMLRWKYLYPRPDWPQPRSFVLRDDADIVAHAGIWPVVVAWPQRELRGAHIIDWAGSTNSPGAGVLLLRMLSEQLDFLLTIGGGTATRNILPRVGYRLIGHDDAFVRPLRPWRALQSLPSRDWKSGLRFLRNLRWSLARVPPIPRQWTVSEWTPESQPLEDVIPQRCGTIVMPRREPAAVYHLLACPEAVVRVFIVERDRRPCGYFLLSRVLGQMRLADLRVDSDSSTDWVVAAALATRTALTDPLAFELVADASAPPLRAALHACGFVSRQQLPVFIYSRQVLPEDLRPHFQMIDGDAAHLATPATPLRS